MKRRRLLGWAAAACVLIPSIAVSEARAACLRANNASAALDGHLVRKVIGGESVFILQLKVPECLTGSDPEDNVKATRAIHLYSNRSSVRSALSRHVGKDVYVAGRPFAAITQHHKAPIVIEVTKIDVLD